LISEREQAAVTIQKTYRGFNSRLIYEVTISDIITTESMARRWRAIRQLFSLRDNHTKEVNAVTKIQAAFVSFTARKNYLYMLSRVLICQSAFRQKIAKIRCNSLLAKKESAALMIQKTYRGFAGQKLVPKKAIQEFSQPPIHPTPENPFTPTAEAPAAGPACRLSSRRLIVLGLGSGGATSLGLGVGLGKQKNALTALNTTQVPTAAPAIDDICRLDLTAAPAT
jgi:hypothetical protein